MRSWHVAWLAVIASVSSTSLDAVLTSTYGPGGTGIPCAYGTSYCYCYAIFLRDGGYTGTLPSALGDCTGLGMLAFEGNSLTGSIPSSFSSLTGLAYLNLNSNQLTGPIDTLNYMTTLYYLDLESNLFTGELAISGLTSLQHL